MSPYAGPRVSLVDDDASMRHAIERILQLGGYAPLTFSSAESFLDSGLFEGLACLILDVHLPALSGFELLERLRRDKVPIPVIVITAYDEPETRQLALAGGAAAYFTKPFSGHDLVAAITQAIAEHGAPTQGR